jgi:hypothetical protein
MRALNAITFTPAHYNSHANAMIPAAWVGWSGGRQCIFSDTRAGVIARAEEEGVIIPKRVRNE